MVNEPRSAGMGGLGRASGDLEAALAALEPVDVDGLSLDVSQDVFGRWCDACSRLAQTTGAWLVRYAPAQGRGLILLKDPAHPHELQVFSPLGMGSDYPQGVTITPFLDEQGRRDPAARKRAEAASLILRRAREFRAAAAEPVTTGGTFAAATASAAPTHHEVCAPARGRRPRTTGRRPRPSCGHPPRSPWRRPGRIPPTVIHRRRPPTRSR